MSDTKTVSLESHCTACKAKCCHDDRVILTQAERDKVINAGHPDHFKTITIRNVDYHIIDFKPYVSQATPTPCPYLGENKQCSIQEVKPLICAIYPYNAEYSVSQKCPAVRDNALPKDYQDKVTDFVEEFRKTMTSRLFWEIHDENERQKRNRFYGKTP